MKIGGYTSDLRCSDTNGLLVSWLQFIDTRRETQFLKVFCNHTMLTPPPTFGTSQFISADRDPKNSTLRLKGWIIYSPVCLNDRNSIVCLQGPMSTLNYLFFKIFFKTFFKIFKFSRPSLPSLTSSTFQSHFLSGDNGDCHIFCARA